MTLSLTNIFQTLDSINYGEAIFVAITQTYPELLIFTISLVLYAFFSWFFYKNLSKRDLFKLDLGKYDFSNVDHKRVKKAGSVFVYVLKHGIIFPVYVAFWFVVFSLLLFLMAKNIQVREIILIAMSLVSAVRITAYLKKDLSQDLAKLIPLAMLAIFLSDPNFFSGQTLITRIESIPSLGLDILGFLSFSILLEWTLRILYHLDRKIRGKEEVPEIEYSQMESE